MNLKEYYQKTVIPQLRERFGYQNALAVPRVVKVVVNIGVSSQLKDQQQLQEMTETLRDITGQKPLERPARKSISNFKIRKGQTVGLTVTLRGKMMYDFLEKFIHLTLPRVRDFRGLSPQAVDERGNWSIGLREVAAFPEMIKSGAADRQHGLEVTVVTSAAGREPGYALLKLLGFPFKEQ